MKKSVIVAILATLFLYACQRDIVEKANPDPEENNGTLSIEQLKESLSRSTGAAKDEIIYAPTDTSFVIEGDMTISRNEAEGFYTEGSGAAGTHQRWQFLVGDNYAGNIKVFIQPNVPVEWVTATKEAIAEWNVMKGTKINFVQVFNSNGANISVRVINDPTEPIGRGKLPFSNGQAGSLITINMHYNYLSTRTKITTMVHELGHTIGLLHTNKNEYGDFPVPIPGSPVSDPYSVMNSSVRHDWVAFTSGDVKAVQTLYPAGDWVQFPGSATDFAVSANGRNGYAIGQDAMPGGYGIYKWSGSSWDRLPGAAAKVAVTPEGVPWVVNTSGTIYRFNGSLWEQYPGYAKDIAVGGDGSVYIVGGAAIFGGYGIYRWNGSTWLKLPGAGLRVSVGLPGVLWIVDDTGKIFNLTGNNLKEMPGLAHDIGAGADGTVYMLQRTPVYGGYTVYRWSGIYWSKTNGSGISIAVTDKGIPWVVNNLGNIWYQNF
ncbi:M57 family metalloprotease [Dyadobacter arcticus]|uniref:Dual-action HEIGH metallo-peptidase n=1 Tax=Dyadobacter arcticus TaxID=1078754 RepID=A0ABX0URR6_9BACT|nr:M57 family metalloprotease [Dyadobacter arcticus]NIJ55512.1 hypothetical protein [Dyadobacter arcticus]